MRHTVVKEIDFSGMSERDRRRHPDIDEKHRYIALIDGFYWIGTIRGHNFHDGWGSVGHQFDPPGTNGCYWQKVWKVIDANGLRGAESILMGAGLDPVQIAIDDEMNYAQSRRRYCIDHRCTSGGRTITEESPIEAWLYHPTAPMMPPREDDDNDDL